MPYGHRIPVILTTVTTAFVISGGGNLGALHVGMLSALAEAGIRPDLIVATSVGAVNAGWVASRPDSAGIDGLADLWRSLSRKHIFPARPLDGLLGFLGRRPNLLTSNGLRRLLTENLEFTRLEDAPIPLHVVATDVLSGQDVLLSSGDAVDAIAASAAIPAVFPPVRIDGRYLIDGGVVNNTPLSHAIALGADVVWVLPTSYSCALPSPPKGALAIAMQALNLLINRRLAVDVDRFENAVDLRVIPQPCPINTARADFSQSGALIELARESTRAWLAGPRAVSGQAGLLGPHSHG